ncbi:energy transducer TonB [Marinicella meishanensis]|uniref:energy transducer TonB n=1 Tax=Marinicella meishanensis TaxID=2873263 RepID=UPI001CBFB35C|nr:energy transducer TonB [Marinicella sp. NBU2979]
MEKMIRFSLAGLLGLGITAALFIGMKGLLSQAKKPAASSDLDFKFSWVNEYEEVKTTPRDRPEEPEQQTTAQAPAMPLMQPDTGDTTSIDLPLPNTSASDFNLLAGFKFNGVGTGITGTDFSSGGVQTSMAPMYPREALINKTEGWVKLLISVNEFGMASSVEVLQAKPARVFNDAAKRSVMKWRFHPKVVDGQAVPYQVTQTIEFTIDQP